MMKERIGGNDLGQYIGDKVILLGKVVQKTSNGKNIELKTTDDAHINVALPEPLTENVEGYIEVHGTAQSKSTINCSSYIQFPSAMSETFNPEQYNELLVILKVMGQKKYKIGIE